MLDAAHDAIELLRATPEIDGKRVVVVGHSEGGYLAPRIAKENPAVAGWWRWPERRGRSRTW